MTTIQPINNGDSGLSARTKINSNDSNLNADKLETALKGALNGLAELDGSGVVPNTQISAASVTQHEGAIKHNSLDEYSIEQHRIINDAGSSLTELLSANKILSLISGVSSGVDLKDPCDTSTEGLGNITLSGEQTLNGLLTSGSRVMVTDQTNAAENGPYLTAAGAWARTTDADTSEKVSNGMSTMVLNSGSTKYRAEYRLSTPDPINLGVTLLNFVEIPPLNFGVTAGTAVEGNDTRLPTQDENDALAGTDGVPSTANKYVTNSDARNTNSRTCNNTFDDVNITKTNLSLNNVDNTSDADKPVSTSQQTALDGKENANPNIAKTNVIQTYTEIQTFGEKIRANRAIIQQTGLTPTLALTDANTEQEMNNAAAQTLTVPPNASVPFPIGTEIEVIQIGAGAVTIVAGAGVTINSKGGLLALSAQYAEAILKKRAADTWTLVGDLA